MAHLISGFSPSESAVFRNAMITGQKAVVLAYADITTVRRNKAASPLYLKWFGTYDKGRAQTVFEKINAIHYALTASSLKCVKIICPTNDQYYAAAFTPDEGWGLHNVKQIIASGGYEIEYSQLFFQDVSEDDGGKHPRALTFIHELSHTVAHTEDEDWPQDTSKQCYGQQKCKHIAINNRNLAINNADNYGFYCTGFLP